MDSVKFEEFLSTLTHFTFSNDQCFQILTVASNVYSLGANKIIQSVPIDIWNYILNKYAENGCLKILNCYSVCKLWNHTIRSFPKISICNVNSNGSDKLDKFFPNLTKLSILDYFWCKSFDLKLFTNLRSLSITGNGTLYSDSLIGYPSCLTKLKLKKLRLSIGYGLFNKPEHLKYLKLVNISDTTNIDISKLTNLVSLKISGSHLNIIGSEQLINLTKIIYHTDKK